VSAKTILVVKLATVGERLTRSQEVSGWIPLKYAEPLEEARGFLWFKKRLSDGKYVIRMSEWYSSRKELE